MTFRGLLLDKNDEGVTWSIQDIDESQLPDRPVEIDVEYSTINYKDGMALMGRPGIIRSYPMIPGVDVVGTVAASADDSIAVGSRVTVNGFDVGEAHWGGLAQKCRVDANWPTPIPDALSSQQAAAIGTAGYTAMLCAMKLEDHGVTPDSGPILVTGAAGGVGSVAIAVLAKLGYEVIASSGRAEAEGEYLRGLGASDVIDRAELSGDVKPFTKPLWAGAVDAVGSNTLANVLARILPNGTVAACGLVQGPDLPGSVLPFILRGVTLAGVNCVHEPQSKRIEAWNRLVTDLDAAKLEEMTTTVAISDVGAVAADILDGKTRGRVVVDVNA